VGGSGLGWVWVRPGVRNYPLLCICGPLLSFRVWRFVSCVLFFFFFSAGPAEGWVIGLSDAGRGARAPPGLPRPPPVHLCVPGPRHLLSFFSSSSRLCRLFLLFVCFGLLLLRERLLGGPRDGKGGTGGTRSREDGGPGQQQKHGLRHHHPARRTRKFDAGLADPTPPSGRARAANLAGDRWVLFLLGVNKNNFWVRFSLGAGR